MLCGVLFRNCTRRNGIRVGCCSLSQHQPPPTHTTLVLGKDLKRHPSVGRRSALAMLCAGWAAGHTREKQCIWSNPADTLGAWLPWVLPLMASRSLTVWSGVQAGLTRSGGEKGGRRVPSGAHHHPARLVFRECLQQQGWHEALTPQLVSAQG